MAPRLAHTARFWLAAAAGSMLYLRPANLNFCSAYAETASRNHPAVACAPGGAASVCPFPAPCTDRTIGSTFEHDATVE